MSTISCKNNLSEKSDSELWIDLKEGNPNALNSLFYRFYNDLFFYGKKLCNDDNHIIDTIQDIFANLWENKKKLSEVVHIKAYIFKIFRNKLLKTSNKYIVNTLLPDDNKLEKEFIISHEDIIVEYETKTRTTKIITTLLEALTDKQREIIYLKFYCNLSNSEISQSLSIEKQSVSNLLNRTFNTLREKLNKNNLFSLFMYLIFFKFWNFLGINEFF